MILTIRWKITQSEDTSSVQFSRSVVSDSLRPHESQHARPPCPSPTLGVYSNSCPSSQRCHPAISSSVVPFSSCLQSLPASGSFPMSQLFAWGGQSIGVSALASFLPMKTQDWSPLGWTGSVSIYFQPLNCSVDSWRKWPWQQIEMIHGWSNVISPKIRLATANRWVSKLPKAQTNPEVLIWFHSGKKKPATW